MKRVTTYLDMLLPEETWSIIILDGNLWWTECFEQKQGNMFIFRGLGMPQNSNEISESL